MIKKNEKIIKTCDICAKEVEHFASTTKECKVISIGLMGGVS